MEFKNIHTNCIPIHLAIGIFVKSDFTPKKLPLHVAVLSKIAFFCLHPLVNPSWNEL